MRRDGRRTVPRIAALLLDPAPPPARRTTFPRTTWSRRVRYVTTPSPSCTRSLSRERPANAADRVNAVARNCSPDHSGTIRLQPPEYLGLIRRRPDRDASWRLETRRERHREWYPEGSR